MMVDFLFACFAIGSVLGAVGLIFFRHPMNGAMSFLITLISMAGLYALLSAKLLFALQLIVYAGAIMSLIVFIIMFLNILTEQLPKEKSKLIYLVAGAAAVSPIAFFLIKVINRLPDAPIVFSKDGFGEVKEVGLLFFHNWLVPFEIVSILLLVSLIGAVVLAGRREKSK